MGEEETMSETGNGEAFSPERVKQLRRYAREARNTYVGRHWPSMEDMRRDGMGYALVEGNKHEAAIRRFIATFQPEFVLDLLATLTAAREQAATEARRSTLDEVLRGLRSEDDSTQLRAIIVSVEALR